MSTITELNPRLLALTEAGVSVWLDQIRRSMVEGGELARMVAVESLRGVTSNPAIFEKAILGSDDYDEDLRTLARENLDSTAIYERIAIRDVQLAADVMADVHRSSNGRDGFVSLEVAPELAHDTEGTIEQVRSFWQRVNRANVMIKIPGTPEGVPAIEQALYEGINVNVTLLFSVAAYEKVAEAYISALERRQNEGLSLDVNSVASFFVSRVDTLVDRQLDQLGRTDLAGKAALANARAAYRRFQELFSGPRWEGLRHGGAAVQRPLWASTGVKNPHYPDTMYVDGLVGAHSVNTMPLPTLLAFADHGNVTGPTSEHDPTDELAALAEAGVDLDQVTDELLVDGVKQFEEAMTRLIAGVEEQRAAVVTGQPSRIQARLPMLLTAPVGDRVKRAVADNVAQRVWRRDVSLWGEPGTPEIEDRLGWLTVSEPMLEHAADLHAFADQCRADGFTDAVLLGMGGSSLGPEVIRRSFGSIPDALRLQVLDSTHPDEVLRVQESVDLERTLFVVSSKSGSTIETLSHYRYFASMARPDQFVVVTDPGSPLQRIAADDGLRRCFLNPADIGGRYSVLSYFGLVPAALMGVNIEALLHRCQVAEQMCAHYDSSESNSGLWFGATIGELARQGRDKLTFVVSSPIESFGLWAEQLVAESTGKLGRGILPVVDEPLSDSVDVYGEDRVFAYRRNPHQPEERLDAVIEALAGAGHPTITLPVHGAADLGRIFFLTEFAVAVAGWVLEINPFDQPNVQEAKDATARVLGSGDASAAGSTGSAGSADDNALRALLDDLRPPGYLAILGYLPPSDEVDAAVADLRVAIRAATGVATTFGYGPRYLHSTGQLHKGGASTGRFLQIVGTPERDAEIPGAGYSFGTLIAAQASGDLETLRAHGLPAERVEAKGDSAAAVRALTERITAILQES
ncbi:MAG TPA: bifunctional transaldolase/phosoglucose isomerase [Solirubrobacteraceae bacterium]|nr:bifunctional transaldolase/phosoglucose isomerase [Solirubrobacteraceae bacterium]